MSEMLSGGEIVIRSLKDAGVEHVWGYPGGAALHIYDALFRQDDVHHLLVRHEQAAVHAADGFSRATGKVGTVLVTSGPGATNAITGIATAYMDSIPLVVISGQVAMSKIGQDAFQETDMVGVSRPIVKHSFWLPELRILLKPLPRPITLPQRADLDLWLWISLKMSLIRITKFPMNGLKT